MFTLISGDVLTSLVSSVLFVMGLSCLALASLGWLCQPNKRIWERPKLFLNILLVALFGLMLLVLHYSLAEL